MEEKKLDQRSNRKSSSTNELTVREAINSAIAEEMRLDKDVF